MTSAKQAAPCCRWRWRTSLDGPLSSTCYFSIEGLTAARLAYAMNPKNHLIPAGSKGRSCLAHSVSPRSSTRCSLTSASSVSHMSIQTYVDESVADDPVDLYQVRRIFDAGSLWLAP